MEQKEQEEGRRGAGEGVSGGFGGQAGVETLTGESSGESSGEGPASALVTVLWGEEREGWVNVFQPGVMTCP